MNRTDKDQQFKKGIKNYFLDEEDQELPLEDEAHSRSNLKLNREEALLLSKFYD